MCVLILKMNLKIDGYFTEYSPQDKDNIMQMILKQYNNEDDHGLVKTDENGNVKITFHCPQPYKVNKITC